MRLEDFERKVLDDFNGLYSRGDTDDCPQDHFSDCLNIDYDVSEWKTRPGLVSHIDLGYAGGNGKVRRFASFADPRVGPIVLILDDQGNLYTYSERLGDTATTPRLTVPGAIDFVALKMLGKIFIAFSDGEFGLAGQSLKVFVPGMTIFSDEFRNAAGLAPVGSPIVAADGVVSTLMNPGTYQIGVVFITSTGFITQPGPKVAGIFTPTSYTSPGSVQIDLSNIPTGASDVVARQIVITKADLLTFYLLPSKFGGIINDNVTTTATLDFDDITDLVNSADYLFNLLEVIPAPLVLHDINGRLATGGEFDNPSILRVSAIGDVESFDATTGIVFVNKDDGFTIKNTLNLRSNFYVWKNLGVYSVNSTTGDPSTWAVPPAVDEVISASVHGIAQFFEISAIKTTRDWTLVADKSGILLFDGIVRKQPLTWKINNVWKTLNFTYYSRLVLAVDEQNHKIYCAFPANSASENNTLIVGNYNECSGNIPDYIKIKWAVWQFKSCDSAIRPTHIGLFGFPPDTVPTFKIGSIDGQGTIWSLNESSYYDDDTDIESFFKTSLLYWEPGNVHFFTALRLKVIGSGVILCSIEGTDDILTANLPSIPLSTTDFRFAIKNFSNAVDGTQILFTFCKTLIDNFIAGFQNGLLITKGVDFTVSGNTIIMTSAPLPNDTLQFLYRIGSNASSFVLESQIGAINGSNTAFTLSNNIRDVGIAGFQNGLLLKTGIDFSIAVGSNAITMAVAPLTGDTLQFMYHKDTIEPGFLLEEPLGAINGSNTVFNALNAFGDNFVAVFQNGLLLQNFKDYYTIGDDTIILLNAPFVDDIVQIIYRQVQNSQYLGKERLIRFNFQSEKAKIKCDLLAGKFIVTKSEFFGKPIYPTRPA